MIKMKDSWEWWREHVRARRLSYVTIWLIFFITLLSGALLAPHVSTIDDSPLNQYLDFSGDNPAAMRLTKKAYNPKKQRLVLWLDIKSAGSDAARQVIDSDVVFKVATLNARSAEVTVVPTTTNHFVLLIDHLAKKFGALQVEVKNNTPQTAAGGTITRGGQVSFIINEKSSLNDSQLPQLSREEYAQQAVTADIKNEIKKQSEQNKLIAQANAAIAADQEKIGALEKEIEFQTSSEKEQTQDAIESLTQDQTENQNTIKQAQNSIKASQNKTDLLREKQAAIAEGSYQFPAPQKTLKIKN